MGFFKDFKRDFAQAVNELMPDKSETSGEYDDEDMVNTFDENDNMEVAEEDLVDDLEDFSIENTSRGNKAAMEEISEEESSGEVPEAELINDAGGADVDSLDGEASNQLVSELTVEDTVLASDEEIMQAKEELLKGDSEDDAASDELKALDDLDESDMEDGMEDEEKLHERSDELEELDGIVGKKVNISKDVSDAMVMRDEAENDVAGGNDDWEGSMAEIEQVKDEEMRESNIESIMSDDTTYISKGTTVNGSISTEGSIDIIGAVTGDVSCVGKLILGGTITGNVLVGELYANAAKIEGDVVSEGSAKIGVGSVIVGNITASSAVIAGAIKGDIDVKGPVIVDSTAVIMGNIKSRSVQINNGAVIEGLCSQCYAEIDVKSFFE